MDTMDQRVRVLERELVRSRRINRTLVVAMVAAICIAGVQGAVPAGQKPPQPPPPDNLRGPGAIPADVSSIPQRPLLDDALPTVEAGQFVLVDRLGRTRMRMQATDDGPAISMLDEQGQTRIEIGQSSRASGIRLYDADGQVASLQLPHDGNPARLEFRTEQGSSRITADGISVRDAGENQRLHLMLINGNLPMLGISQSGQQGPSSIEMTVGEAARSVKIHDQTGLPLFSLHATDDGDSFLNVRHPDHERSLQISTTSNRGPGLAFFTPVHEDGTGGLLPRVQIGVDDALRPFIRAVDDDGRRLPAKLSK